MGSIGETEELCSQQSARQTAAGFWVRYAAAFIDATLVVCAVVAVKAVLAKRNVYVPLELCVIISFLVYNAAAIAVAGKTFGKWVCGLTVQSMTGRRPELWRVFVREIPGKLLSGVCATAGFIWAAFRANKRGWHDYLAGTCVRRAEQGRARGRVAVAVTLAITVLALSLFAVELGKAYALVRRLSPPADYRFAYKDREPSGLKEVSTLGAEDDAPFVDWVESEGKNPIEYAVAKAQQHQVLLIGEMHERRENLEYLNRLVPELHARAGVTCLAMEVCLAEDNDLLERLVNAPQFDRDLALEIARHQPWGLWGWKEYWDVLETVWGINQTLKPGEQRMRIVGLDQPTDMPSLVMLGLEDNAGRDVPVWERLRVWRLLIALPRLQARDAFMASEIEKEIIQKGQRAIVWIGAMHTTTRAPAVASNGVEMPRTGLMLESHYGEAVFQIRLHAYDISVSDVGIHYEGPAPRMREFLERVMDQNGNQPVGFDVENSPFAALRDSALFDYAFEPRLGFGDLATGYVYLVRWKQSVHCSWLRGYISDAMFVAQKPLYQAFARRGDRSCEGADDINAFFSGPGM